MDFKILLEFVKVHFTEPKSTWLSLLMEKSHMGN